MTVGIPEFCRCSGQAKARCSGSIREVAVRHEHETPCVP
jgi:hypothetical protein